MPVVRAEECGVTQLNCLTSWTNRGPGSSYTDYYPLLISGLSEECWDFRGLMSDLETDDIVCLVCQQKLGKTRCHYGGVTCYSCRAFFRRNTQRSELPVCKSDGGCPITTTVRKQCAACRYQKCLRYTGVLCPFGLFIESLNYSWRFMFLFCVIHIERLWVL